MLLANQLNLNFTINLPFIFWSSLIAMAILAIICVIIVIIGKKDPEGLRGLIFIGVFAKWPIIGLIACGIVFLISGIMYLGATLFGSS